MPVQKHVQLDGLDEILTILKGLGATSVIKPGLKAGALHIKGVVANYPDRTAANDPSAQKWYERGYGPKWRVKSGDVHGTNSSETHGRGWTIKAQNQGLTQIVGNDTGYGPFLQDRNQQLSWHKQHGWKTIQDVGDEEKDKVTEFVKQYVDKWMSANAKK